MKKELRIVENYGTFIGYCRVEYYKYIQIITVKIKGWISESLNEITRNE